MMTVPRAGRPAAEMVGRELDLVGLQGRLQDPSIRLTTLTGAGGVGKSRLAAEAARTVTGTFPGGIHTVDLPSCADLDAAVKHIDRVACDTGTQRSLLVLDGLEHLAAQIAPTVADYLVETPALTVLATGQEVLGIYGERVVPVPPLLPPGPLLDPDVADVQDNPAVQLFTRRAHETNPEFALTTENVKMVVDICNLLEGVPLVLELAARRLRLFPLPELCAWLHRGGDSHLSGPVDVPPRQRSVLAIAEWSCRSLSRAERALLARLALCRQGATLATTEQISPLNAADTAAALEVLLDRSLLTLDEHPHTEARLTMSRTVRRYGLALLEKADPKEAAAARQAHAHHYEKLQLTLEGRFRGSEQQRWLRVAAAEHDNVLAALCHLEDAAAPSDPLRRAALVTACLRPWLVRGELAAGLHRFDSLAQELRGHDSEESEERLRARARLYAGAGTLAAALDDHEGACHRYRRALALCKRLRDPAEGALASARMGHALFRCGDRAVGQSLLTSARATLEAHGDTGGSAEAAAHLAEVLFTDGQLEQARALLERAERVQRQNGEIRDLARTLFLGARLSLLEGGERAEADAETALRESIGLYDSIGERTELADVLDAFALLTRNRAGQPQRAARL
ncbi:LuxR family transcriptional regulator, partial [Streptomyces sp. T-3]|nr:LuxR family transcriptional regulator [Streptomyces sp. T-3]